MRLPFRPLAAAAIAVVAVAGSAIMPSSAWAALLGLLGGAIAVLVGWNAFFFPEAPVAQRGGGEDGRRLAGEIVAPLPEPTLLLDGGRILTANPAARRLFGETIEGQDLRLAIRHPLALEAIAAHDGIGVDEIEVTGLGEAERRWLLTVATLPEGLRLVRFADRSEAHAAEKMRVDFVANASHELRTPLATILGFVETLRDDAAGGDPELRARFLGIMDGEAKRMQVLIDDLMSLSRIEAERFRPPTDPIDLCPVVEEVRAACDAVLAERGNSLKIDNRSHSTVVAGDHGQLTQLIRNLIVNAVKYGQEGAPITVSFEDAREMVRMTVTDRGEGIDPVHLPRLTERFYRVNAGRSRAQGGTGLGLAIVKHIVWRHRGRLDIRSTPGAGTSVHVLLPRPPAEPVS
ncbi:PAS domain-containing protein [Sphingomonas parva]|uniref:histidine kinase n=1 Tax=Sphingomonas parva TaxID=2555898 RepID=A0A4Y8ZVI5_9SPHN|nr:ATP-binding protein [Sphingomonas parva]TFI60063.1 PAS domain-containing protein [Sphingomonas parva]